MLSNTGIVALEEVIKSIFNPAIPYVRKYRHFLINSRINYIKGLIGKVLSNQDLTYSKEANVASYWRNEEPWFRLNL